MTPARNKTLVAIIAVLLLSNITMLLYFVVWKEGGKPGHGDNKRRSPMTEFLQKDIGFSPQQLATFDSLKQRHFAALRPLGEDLGRSRDSLYLLAAKNPGDSVLQSAADAIGRRQSALELRLFENFLQIRHLCTPEQLPRFDSL
ncbi:MAG TPA: periplasmic heavy metal sensor, partial [Chitinophagaceae bacterium]|nr:periplasmic heavy metal sensor [Chitinophagaceae bacterium]